LPRGEARVERDAVELETGAAQRLELLLRALQVFGRVAGEPGLEGDVVGAVGLPRHERAVRRRRDTEGGDDAAVGLDPQAERGGALRRLGVDPLREFFVDHRAHGRHGGLFDFRDRESPGIRLSQVSVFSGELEHPLEQGLELQLVEHGAHGGLVDRLAFEVGGSER
jgi:hypothetical protein